MTCLKSPNELNSLDSINIQSLWLFRYSTTVTSFSKLPVDESQRPKSKSGQDLNVGQLLTNLIILKTSSWALVLLSIKWSKYYQPCNIFRIFIHVCWKILSEWKRQWPVIPRIRKNGIKCHPVSSNKTLHGAQRDKHWARGAEARDQGSASSPCFYEAGKRKNSLQGTVSNRSWREWDSDFQRRFGELLIMSLPPRMDRCEWK